MAGIWRIFEKSGIKGWWALLPGAREYQLACCAGRESEGPVYSLASAGSIALQVISLLLSFNSTDVSTIEIMIVIASLVLALVSFIYSIRVYAGLIDVYGVRKRWLWLWVLPYTSFIPALLWGFGKKYQPAWKVEDIRTEMARLATHGSASVMSEGLTVNLTERSATEFFKKKVLLRDIHMAIPQGHMVLLLGGSGAGKTTYLNAINGYEKAKAEVLLNGTDLYKHYKKMQYEVGFVPQSEMMRGKDTVLNTLMDAARLRLPKEVSSEQRKARVNEVMEIFGLLPVKNNLVEKLSGGQKKRLSISMEFISNPSLFILDEPDSGLDGVMARELFEQLRKIADTGKIVIVITHTPDRVIDLFDDVIVLAKDSARTGRLAYYGSIKEARRFFGRDKMEQIVKSVNRKEEGGDGLADEFVLKYAKEVA
ncbi:MAG: ABC transporter ATP-binding protein [Clostridia bacterium]|nr:ABC transporter ATP-binding protein [Clostridia bacterium]MBR4332425.1 ABC transporter ATP-binding protein [Clostridia bacterium]